MRDFYFFTSKPITIEDCFDALKSEIKNVDYYDQNGIFIKGKHRSYIHFENDRLTDFIFEDDEDYEEFKNKIKVDNPYVTDFETYRSIDAKRVITVLMKLRPELYVFVDDDDFYGTAQEYLDTEFNY